MRLSETRGVLWHEVVNAYINYIHQYAIINKYAIVILANVIVMKILRV